MLTRRLHPLTLFLARLILSVLSLLLLVTIASFIHFHLQHPDTFSLVTLGPAVLGQVVQMVRMTTTWAVQSTFCPDSSPPSPHPLCQNITPAGCILPPPHKYTDSPQSVGLRDNICCSFSTENLRPASCLIERDMFSVAAQVITPEDVVLMNLSNI